MLQPIKYTLTVNALKKYHATRFLSNRKSLLITRQLPLPQAHLKQLELAGGCENRFLFPCTNLARKLNVVYVELKKEVNILVRFQCQSPSSPFISVTLKP
jgi:hypothetical protein